MSNKQKTNDFLYSSLVWVLLVILLMACTSTQSLANSPVIQSPKLEEAFDKHIFQEIRTVNCDGANPTNSITRSLLQEQTTFFEIEVSAGGLVRGTPIPEFLQAEIESKIKTAISRDSGDKLGQEITVNLETPPGTAFSHTITWKETIIPGEIDLLFQDGTAKINFEKVVNIELFDRQSEPIPCNNITTVPTSELIATLTTLTPSEPLPTIFSTVTSEPPPTNAPITSEAISPPSSPRIFNSSDKIPSADETTLTITVNEGEVHLITAGPLCVSGTGVCLPGGANNEKRGSVVVLLPRNEPYLLTNLVPLNNWHGAYYAQSTYAQSMAETSANGMMVKSPTNSNCTGGCDIIDILIIGSDGIVSSYTVQS